jgi:hypothetical protein
MNKQIDQSKIPYFRGRCLYRFLISRGIYRQYLFNSVEDIAHKSLNIKNKDDILKWLDKNTIMSAFIWNSTNEGDVFWSKINDEWNKNYRKIGVEILNSVK